MKLSPIMKQDPKKNTCIQISADNTEYELQALEMLGLSALMCCVDGINSVKIRRSAKSIFCCTLECAFTNK